MLEKEIEIHIRPEEIYAVASLLHLPQLVGIPEMQIQVTAEELEEKNFAEEEFDGTIKITPVIAAVAGLCAIPEAYYTISLSRENSSASYRIYESQGVYLLLIQNADDFTASFFKNISQILKILAPFFPVGICETQRKKLSANEAATFFSESESCIQLTKTLFPRTENANADGNTSESIRQILLFCRDELWWIEDEIEAVCTSIDKKELIDRLGVFLKGDLKNGNSI